MKRYYNAVTPAGSCMNQEHAGVSAWGRENEVAATRNALERFAPDGIAGLLTDTFNHDNFIRNIMGGVEGDDPELPRPGGSPM